MGNTEQNLKSAISGETHEYTDMYPGMARTAEKKALMKSPIGLRHLQKQRSLTAVSLKGRLTIIYKMLNISLINNIDGDNIRSTQIQRTYLIRRRNNMDFESLKSSASNFDKITKALEGIQINQRPSGNSKNKYQDDRLWKPELDKTGNGYAVIRFLQLQVKKCAAESLVTRFPR